METETKYQIEYRKTLEKIDRMAKNSKRLKELFEAEVKRLEERDKCFLGTELLRRPETRIRSALTNARRKLAEEQGIQLPSFIKSATTTRINKSGQKTEAGKMVSLVRRNKRISSMRINDGITTTE